MGQKNTTVQFRKEIVKQEESLCYSTYAGDESEIDYLTDVNDYYGKEAEVQTRKVKNILMWNVYETPITAVNYITSRIYMPLCGTQRD